VYHDEIPLDRPSTANIVEEIGKHFAAGTKEPAADKLAKQQ
jgi:hypothetical protein